MSFKGFISLTLTSLIVCGVIKTNNHQYINLSTSSPQLSSTYTFDFTLPSLLPQDANITIAFPPESYNAGLATSKTQFKTYLYTEDITNATTLSQRTFLIALSRQLQPSSTLQITINSLFNPFKSGGTGNFIITTVDKHGLIIDQSMAFGSIGISQPSLNLTDLSAAFTSNLAGQSVNMTFSFTSLAEMQTLPEIYIEFPKGYDTSYVSSCTCQFSTMCSHQSSYISVTNFTLKKGQNVSCRIANITNPKFQIVTLPIDFYIRTQSSSAIQQSGALPPNIIVANRLNLSAATNQTLFDSIVRTIRLSISSINPYSSMKIVTPINITAIQSQMPCNSTILYNVIWLTDISSLPSTQLEIEGYIQQQRGYLKTQMIEAYAYLDNNYEYLVAYSNSTNLTQLQPSSGSPITTTLSQVNNVASMDNTITMSFPAATQIAIQMPSYVVYNCSSGCQYLNDTLTMHDTNMAIISVRNPVSSGSYNITIVLNQTYFSQHTVQYLPATLQTSIQYMYNVGYVITNDQGTMRVQNQHQYGCYNQCTITNSYIDINTSNIILTQQSPITVSLISQGKVQSTVTANQVYQFNIPQQQLDDLSVQYLSWNTLTLPSSDWLSITLPANLTVNNAGTTLHNGILIKTASSVQLNVSIHDGYVNQSTMVITVYSGIMPTVQYTLRVLSVVSPIATTLLNQQYANHPYSNYTFQHNTSVRTVLLSYPSSYNFTSQPPQSGIVTSTNTIMLKQPMSVFGIMNPPIGHYSINISYLDQYNNSYYTSTIHYEVLAAVNPGQMTVAIYANSTQSQVVDINIPVSLMPKYTAISLQLTNITYANMTPYTSGMQLMQHITDCRIQLYNLTVSHTTIRIAIQLTYKNTVFYSDSQDIRVSDSVADAAVVSVQQDPSNSAEVSTHTFLLDRQCQAVLITFDRQYMPTMTPRNKVYSDKGKVTLFHHNVLVTQLNSDRVSLFGIVNPNRNRVSITYSVSILDEHYAVVATALVNGVPLTIPPKIMEINYIRRSNSLARYVATYYFGITIPYMPQDATIYIDYPEQYWVDSFTSCHVDDSFSLDTYCTINGFRMAVHTNHVESTNIPINIQVNGIRNPEKEGATSNFVILVYHQGKILSRSYGNISPSYVTSAYSAEDIPVNSYQPITIEKGILSDAYRIVFNGRAKAPITLTPNILSKEIIIIPNFIQVQIGDLYAQFRMASSKSTEAVELQLNWTKTNDNVVPLYMPLYRSPVFLTDTVQDKIITAQLPPRLYQNGSSFSYDICTNNPPYDGLEVQMSMDKCHLSSNISQINLFRQCVQYEITCPISVVPGSASLTLQSSRQEFKFVNQSVTIPLMPYASAVPAINSIKILETTRTTITVAVDAPDTMKLVYVIADCGHESVTFLHVFNRQSPQLLYSNPQYSTLYIHPGITNHTIDGLVASHCYQLTLYQLSMFTVQNDTPILLKNYTMEGEKSVMFTLFLRQSHLLTVFQKEYLLSISKILAVDKSRVISDQCNKTTFSGGMLHWNVILRGNNTNQNTNVDPLELLMYLNRSQQTLKAYIPNLIIGNTPYRQHDSFRTSEAVLTSTVSTIVMRIDDRQCETVVATVVENMSMNSTVYQVEQQLTESNTQPIDKFRGLIDRVPYEVTFSNLKNNKEYIVQYIVYRPQLEYNITVWPSVKTIVTMNYKEWVDINSIYLFAGGFQVVLCLMIFAMV